VVGDGGVNGVLSLFCQYYCKHMYINLLAMLLLLLEPDDNV
jgi:hypothetical protein